MQRKRANSCQPTVSVIIAARNEQELIADCLRSVLAQDYPSQLYEIIVIDDNSTDDTRRIAERIASGQIVRIKVLAAPACPSGIGPKKHALSFGISQSTGTILMLTDADCRVSPRWIQSHVKLYDERTGAVAGTVLPVRRNGIVETLRWLERVLVNYTAASAASWGLPASVNGGNFSYRRSLFERVGGIVHSNITSGDDDLMAQAIAHDGWKVRFALGCDAFVTEVRRISAKQFLNASVRHQSTVSLYPFRWRAAYTVSIAAAFIFIISMGFAIAGSLPLIPFFSAFVVRAIIEIPAVLIYARTSGFSLSPHLALLGEVLVPFYTILRPLTSLTPRFEWRGRTHQPLIVDGSGNT